jgi:1-acyl-sn-glycerol-3-phosphate acyltransferase
MNIYPFGKAVACFFTNTFYNVKYEGMEHIPADRGFIVASNHLSYMDPMFVAYKIKQQLHFMAKMEFFKNRFTGALFRSLNAFPVQRDRGDLSAMRHAKKVVEDGGVLAIFPEGTRSRDGKPQRAKPGVSMIAGMVGCGVLPVGISIKGKLGFRTKVTVRFGKFLEAEELGIDSEALSTVRKGAVRIMDEIVSLIDEDCFGGYKK